jgi:hypothetical protein
MTVQEGRHTRSRTKWLTTAFWIASALFMYLSIGIIGWWESLVFMAVGATVIYFWWQRRQHSRYSLLFGLTCAFFSALALFGSGTAILSAVSAPADSVRQTEIKCGSVMSPVPAGELKITDVVSGETVVRRSDPIPQSELDRVCSNQLHYEMGGAAGLAVIGLLLGIRATGHLLTPNSYATTSTPAHQI